MESFNQILNFGGVAIDFLILNNLISRLVLSAEFQTNFPLKMLSPVPNFYSFGSSRSSLIFMKLGKNCERIFKENFMFTGGIYFFFINRQYTNKYATWIIQISLFNFYLKKLFPAFQPEEKLLKTDSLHNTVLDHQEDTHCVVSEFEF